MTDTTTATQQNATTLLEETGGLLDQVISATKQTESDVAKDLLKTLVDEAMDGTVVWDRNIAKTINKAIAMLDAKLSTQLAEVMHAPEFLKLEGSWRGLKYLVDNSATSSSLKLKVLNLNKKDLFKDLDRAVEFDQSEMFKKLYEEEFGTPGGEPFGAIVGDYEFSNHADDIELLSKMSNVSAAAFCPFIAASGPELFGLESWTELSRPKDLEKIFDSKEYSKWRGFRDSEDSRFVSLTMPRALARLPYGSQTSPIDDFGYEEAPIDENGVSRAADHDNYCWMNAAYVMGARLTESFASTGWCTAIRGAEGGGRVDSLPTHVFTSDDGDMDLKCPTEIGITDRREAELSKMGFLPLCHYKNTDYAVFFGGQSTQKPTKYGTPEATANAAISARLPYIMATSRFTHFLKVMGRDKIGSFMEADDVEQWLNRWLLNYVNDNPDSGPDMKAKYPLRAGKVQVTEVPGRPGSYNVVAWMRPWLQMEELSASMRMVARIPQLGK
ncbi:type VI secretion system contractile sheath large subunit [Neptunomonas phycophila]|jgi:type VI secretion system protein ImpC|uniref:Type VI secretion system contractile sheath large subunit n=1 Tax=Neptunomonas phycophila TaxID=1572645 RepID=A0ABT9ESZ6_9GAMM|nr:MULTISPECIES: type VI secretion system contractile sheath large subunit [Neptunomonas]MDN2660938.1 type VI secretion system contractile sheath large subunit [Neptunomonas sp. CHC150]MDO6467415.1 type VI secretion system contractile sheath large subunit [Neptunomonas phycophila]MDP2522189.1 type VI secretion system contractile sheath large subunit [Neptunomonas phycophila]QLE97090.1 type VI secretion system contractile sheath large subunit [Neptunomonas phycophila]